jgi:hypothetical protein
MGVPGSSFRCDEEATASPPSFIVKAVIMDFNMVELGQG